MAVTVVVMVMGSEIEDRNLCRTGKGFFVTVIPGNRALETALMRVIAVPPISRGTTRSGSER